MNVTALTELCETRALQSWHTAFKASSIRNYDWRIETVGDAVCSVCSSDPSILINRVLQLGAETVPTKEQLEDIRRLYAEAGVERFFLQVVPSRMDDDADELLVATGYEKYRGWMKFRHDGAELPTPRSDLEVRQVDASYGEAFAAIVCPAFDMLPASQPVVAQLLRAEGQYPFMSFSGSQPAGTGIIFIDGETGQLDWGSTHPDFRRRGGQSAVLAARLEFGFENGCTTIGTTTGEAVLGDPQHSYSNILKAGFAESYLRENWVPRT